MFQELFVKKDSNDASKMIATYAVYDDKHLIFFKSVDVVTRECLDVFADADTDTLNRLNDTYTTEYIVEEAIVLMCEHIVFKQEILDESSKFGICIFASDID